MHNPDFKFGNMKILYGFLSNHCLSLIESIKGLEKLAYQGNAILKTKFIAQMDTGVVFCALIHDNEPLRYPTFQGEILNIMIDQRVSRKASTAPQSKSTTECKESMSDHGKGTARRAKNRGRIPNAERKRFRKENNLELNEKNWRQFVARRNTILAFYQSSTGRPHAKSTSRSPKTTLQSATKTPQTSQSYSTAL